MNEAETQETAIDAMSEAYDRMMAERPAEDAYAEAAPQEAPQGRARDERGRFASGGQDEAEIPAVEAPTPAEAEITDRDGETADEPAGAQPLSPPDRWSADDKAKFAALPREAQEIVLQRERDVERHLTQKSQEAAELKKQYERLDSVIAPYRQALAERGLDEAGYVSRLIDLDRQASTDPAGFVRWFAQQYNVDLGGKPPEGGEQSVVQSLQSEIVQLKQQLGSKVEGLERQFTQKQQSEIRGQIDAFKSQPGREHFDSVRGQMAALMQSGQAQSLEQAYDMAIWANPEVRAQLMAAEQARQAEAAREAEQKRAQQQKLAAEKARKAAGTQVSQRASLTGGAMPPSSEREALARRFDELMGAA